MKNFTNGKNSHTKKTNKEGMENFTNGSGIIYLFKFTGRNI